ncbi:RNA-binding protein rsd1 [Ceratocystis fimbriata CBS 114723]|uniref:RNA-binding protein rsd1 n=1 Tax=Ceratocystis fimbriata CBS 114723 TaxID=1035309 RepID=A0A2C5X214_9PEZI|nr:RNA-binding protein rsd1 [Ceratocystis fimbriata CBS 114723]
MATLDVEALLDSTAKGGEKKQPRSDISDTETARTESRRERSRSRSRDHGRDYGRDRDRDRASRSHSRSRSRDRDGRRRRSRDSDRNRRSRGDDYYRRRSRSRSPRGGGRRRRRDEYRSRRDRGDRYTGGGERRREDEPRRDRDGDSTPKNTEDERDRRTVFVQQLAARLRTRELKEFFEKVGGVMEAQIVKDRISQRSKGVGYVEFRQEESVAKALQLTGQKLLGIPIIVQVTEAEKNRQARNTEPGNHPNSIPFHRLYVGNIHFNVTEQDLQTVFEPFGDLEFVQLQKDDTGRSRGYGFVQFRNADHAREALEKMNGFDLAGRLIRVGLGNDKFTPESTANMMHKFSGNGPNQGMHHNGPGSRGQTTVFDRASRRDTDKPTNGNVSALDDTDVGGVNFNNYSRDALMRKLARTDEPPANTANGAEERQILKPKTETKPPLPVTVNSASRCVVLRNMFNPEEEEGDNWVKELEDDVRQEAEQKYGHVVHIAVDAHSKGDIYIKFDKVQGGENAIKGLNGRYFGGRMIDASPVVDTVYSSLFSRTRAI